MVTSVRERKAENERRKKERETEDLASAQRLEVEKKKKLARKRETEIARKKKEEEAKAEKETLKKESAAVAGATAAEAARQEAVSTKTAGETAQGADDMDTADGGINDILNEMNTGIGGGDTAEGDTAMHSPARKKNKTKDKAGKEGEDGDEKKKKEKSKKRGHEKSKKVKKRKSSSTSAEEAAEEENVPATPTLLRRGRFSGGATTAQTYKHKHVRWVLDCSVILVNEGLDKFPEFQHALKQLLKNSRKVDPTLVIEAVYPGKGNKIDNPDDIPLNFTDLSMNVKVQGGGRSFEMRKPWRKDGKDAELDEELQNPEVNFSIAFSSDEKPEDVVDRISCEWGRLNGKRMWLKTINSFTTETPVAIYHMLNTAHGATILKELNDILTDAKDRETEKDMFYKWGLEDIPQLALRLNVPKFPGQDTSVFQGWPKRMQWYRKVLHIECDVGKSEMLRDLVELAKSRNLFKPRWGKNVRLSNTAGKESKPQDISNMGRYVRRHVNYHSSMTYGGLVGIVELDEQVPFYAESDPSKVMGEMSLRYVLYKFIKLSGGHTLIGEIHQQNKLSSVDIVVPNAPEAETLVAMMNKNLGAFLNFKLKEEGLNGGFVDNLLKASIDPQLLHTMNVCKWDKATQVMSTPDDAAEEKDRDIENAAWYKDEFGSHMKDKGRKEKRTYAAPEQLFDLDGAHLVNTIFGNKKGDGNEGKGYAGSPGAASINLGNAKKDGLIELDDDSDDMSQLSSMTKDDLIELLRKHKISPLKTKGSAPTSEGSQNHASDSEESHSGSSYDDSSSSSGEESDVDDGTGGG